MAATFSSSATLSPAAMQGVAFEVEKYVARRGLGKARKSSCRFDRQELKRGRGLWRDERGRTYRLAAPFPSNYSSERSTNLTGLRQLGHDSFGR
jgi:hypothetical protein